MQTMNLKTNNSSELVYIAHKIKKKKSVPSSVLSLISETSSSKLIFPEEDCLACNLAASIVYFNLTAKK